MKKKSPVGQSKTKRLAHLQDQKRKRETKRRKPWCRLVEENKVSKLSSFVVEIDIAPFFCFSQHRSASQKEVKNIVVSSIIHEATSFAIPKQSPVHLTKILCPIDFYTIRSTRRVINSPLTTATNPDDKSTRTRLNLVESLIRPICLDGITTATTYTTPPQSFHLRKTTTTKTTRKRERQDGDQYKSLLERRDGRRRRKRHSAASRSARFVFHLRHHFVLLFVVLLYPEPSNVELLGQGIYSRRLLLRSFFYLRLLFIY